MNIIVRYCEQAKKLELAALSQNTRGTLDHSVHRSASGLRYAHQMLTNRIASRDRLGELCGILRELAGDQTIRRFNDGDFARLRSVSRGLLGSCLWHFNP